ncbi:hypothetical protein DFJ73DRAFT_854066 [Zopfochytrium polystomum]|nr:hypothetical protein DFJ73DRAFT_854066 [Zopfochytrium polystomum]
MATASTATTTAAQQNHHSSASATVTAFPEKDLLVRWNAALQWAYIEARAKRAFEARRKQREEQCVMATAHILQKREEIHKRYMDNERKRKLEEKIRVLSQQQESLERIVEAKLSVADSYKKLADSLKSSVVQLRLNNVTVRDPKLLRQSLLELADAATSILKDANGALSRAEQLSAGVVQIDDLMSRQKDGLLKCVGLVHRLQSLETMERSLMIDDIQRRLDMQ